MEKLVLNTCNNNNNSSSGDYPESMELGQGESVSLEFNVHAPTLGMADSMKTLKCRYDKDNKATVKHGPQPRGRVGKHFGLNISMDFVLMEIVLNFSEKPTMQCEHTDKW